MEPCDGSSSGMPRESGSNDSALATLALSSLENTTLSDAAEPLGAAQIMKASYAGADEPTAKQLR